MTLHSGTVKLIIFSLAFAVIFPVFGYALVNASKSYESTIDPSFLKNTGTYGLSSGLTTIYRDDAWVFFDLGNEGGKYQIMWHNSTENYGNFTIITEIKNNWSMEWDYAWWFNSTSETYDSIYYNQNNIYTDYIEGQGYSHTDVRFGYFQKWFFILFMPFWFYHYSTEPAGTRTTWDVDVFMYDSNTERNDVREAIDEGELRINIAKGWNMTTPNLWTFAGWYIGQITFQDPFGLPPIFAMLLWFINILAIISIILLIREFIPFLP
jgi:hypothetical protein